MPIKADKIRELAAAAREFGLAELRVRDDEGSVFLKFASPSDTAKVQAAPTAEPSVLPEDSSFNDVDVIKAPMLGIFYASPAPGEPVFTQSGASVKKGDVLCVIEAMKLMNEIRAERDCEIVDVCVENGSIVEYGQPLFKII